MNIAGVGPSGPSASSGAEHSIPLDHSPRSLRRPISRPLGITLPIVANGTRSPGFMLNAPQQICSASPSPASTSTIWIRSAAGWGRVAKTRATTMPASGASTTSVPSTTNPRNESVRAISLGEPSTGVKSRSQERGARIEGASKFAKETEVVVQEVAHVCEAGAGHGQPVDPETPGEACVTLGVDPDGFEASRVAHAAAAKFYPARAGAGAAMG